MLKRRKGEGRTKKQAGEVRRINTSEKKEGTTVFCTEKGGKKKRDRVGSKANQMHGAVFPD